MSCLFQPKVINQTKSSIELLWCDVEGNEVYKVEDTMKLCQPSRVYWGTAPTCRISGLNENFCYRFQVHSLKFIFDAYITQATSQIIRANTLPNVPTTISIYRSIRKSQEYLLKRYLVGQSELIDVPGPNGLTPLGNATVNGNKDIVEILIKHKVNINLACTLTKRTPLQLAMFHGFVSIAKMLIDQRADIHLVDVIGLNWVHYAIDGGHLIAIKYAMDTICELNENLAIGMTYLHRAVLMRCDEPVIVLLLSYDIIKLNIDSNVINVARLSGQPKVAEIIDTAKNIRYLVTTFS